MYDVFQRLEFEDKINSYLGQKVAVLYRHMEKGNDTVEGILDIKLMQDILYDRCSPFGEELGLIIKNGSVYGIPLNGCDVVIDKIMHGESVIYDNPERYFNGGPKYQVWNTLADAHKDFKSSPVDFFI